MPRQYTNEERARMGGFARAKKLGKRRLKESSRRAAIIRWTRAKMGPPPPTEPQDGPFQKPAA